MRFLSGPELLAHAAPEPEWVWGGFIARRHVTLFSAHPKAGKSTLVDGLLRALAEGAPEYLGQPLPGTPTRAVLVSEETRDGIGARLREWPEQARSMIEVCAREDLHPRPAWPAIVRDAAGHARQLDAPLLVLDTIRGLAGMRDGQELDAGAMTRILDPCLAAAAAGLAVLPLHHDRKALGSPLERLSGNTALLGAADGLVSMSRVRDYPRRRQLDFIGRWRQRSLVAELGADGYVGLGAPTNEQREDRERAVLDCIEAHGPTTASELHAHLAASNGSVSYDRARAMLRELANAGKLVAEGEGTRGNPKRYRVVSVSGSDPGDVTTTNTKAAA